MISGAKLRDAWRALLDSEPRLLTREEVASSMIENPWSSRGMMFYFRRDGTYTYSQPGDTAPKGPYSYQIEADGTLRGETTSYTFFSANGGYWYYHSASEKFYPAIQIPITAPG